MFVGGGMHVKIVRVHVLVLFGHHEVVANFRNLKIVVCKSLLCMCLCCGHDRGV